MAQPTTGARGGGTDGGGGRSGFGIDRMVEFEAASKREAQTASDGATRYQRLAAEARNELPLHNPVAEVYETVAKTYAGIAQQLGEVPELFRRAHEADLQRHEAPRPGEDKWDVRGGGR